MARIAHRKQPRSRRVPPREVSDELFFVRYEPCRMLVAAMAMSPAVELAHRRLCDYYWSTGQFPLLGANGLRELFRCRSRAIEPVLKGLQKAGWTLVRGKLTHPMPAAVLANAETAHRQAIERGRLSGLVRWRKRLEQAARDDLQQTPALPFEHDKKEKRRVLTRSAAERSTLSAKAGAVGNKPAAQFLDEVRGLFPGNPKRADTELANWGGWWTNRFRENPDKARRVLAEVASMVRERRITSNPGAAAFDLWKRLP